MSKIKKANHVSPAMHEEVNKYLTESDVNRSKLIQSSEAHLVAKQLLSDLPIVPTNERIFELAQYIIMGSFNDISELETAHDNWEPWKERTMELLKSQGIILASRLKKVAYKRYQDALDFVVQHNEAELLKEIEDNKTELQYAANLINEGWNYSVLSTDKYNELCKQFNMIPNKF